MRISKISEYMEKKLNIYNENYYDQSWRAIRTRYGEHLEHKKYNSCETSSKDYHVLCTLQFMKLFRHVIDKEKLSGRSWKLKVRG